MLVIDIRKEVDKKKEIDWIMPVFIRTNLPVYDASWKIKVTNNKESRRNLAIQFISCGLESRVKWLKTTNHAFFNTQMM